MTPGFVESSKIAAYNNRRLPPSVLLFTAMEAVALLYWFSFLAVFSWFSIAMFAHFMIMVCADYFYKAKTENQLKRWKQVFYFSHFIFVFTWSSGIALFWVEANLANNIFLLTTATLFLSTYIINNSLDMKVLAYGIAGFVVPFFYIMFQANEVMIGLLACMALVYGDIIFKITKRTHNHNKNLLKLSMELTQEKKFSEQARKKAEAANQAKTHFLAKMSHELRTPLNAIIGFSEILKKPNPRPEVLKNHQSYSTEIYSSGKILLKLINDILDIARIESGHHNIDLKPVKIATEVEDVLTMFQLQAREKSIQLNQQLAPDMETIWADEQAFKQIIFRLVANAVKFTEAGGTVTVAARQDAEKNLTLSVIDTGIGIPTEDLDIILEPFNQGRNGAITNDPSAGLGLPIVKALVGLHNGTIEVESEVGVGTKITVHLPLNEQSNAEQEHQVIQENYPQYAAQ